MTAPTYDASQEQLFECVAMAASSNSWLHQNLLPQHTSQQQQQQQNSNHSLFHHSELQPLHHSQQPGPLQHMNLGHGMDSHPPLHHGMHSALHMPGELHQQQQQQQQQQQHQQQQQSHLPAQNSGQRAGGQSENGDAASVRKVHKADREKLRRDRLNEQFGELAGVLDPDRPKNDKATILGDSVQVVKELRSEVKRLKCEQASLMDESRDLQQEKTELREEKAALKTETEQLQTQLQQRLRGMLPWMSMDPTAALMGAAPYPYAIPVPPQPPPAATSQPLSETPPPPPPASQPPPPAAVVGPSPFLSLAPPGVYMHPFMPYPPPYAAGNHSHVERPYAQYPSGYLVQMPQGGGGSGAPAALPIYRPPYPVLVPPRGGPGYAPPHVQVASSPEAQGVETSLQLQTPGVSAASEPAPQRGTQTGESKTPEGAELELTPPGTKETSNVGSKPDEGGESISALSLASKSLSAATVPSGVAGAAAEGSQQQPHGADTTSLRPAATE